MALADNPEALAAIITGLGGTVIPGKVFRFDLPRGQVASTIPKIHQATGLRVERVAERIDRGDPCSNNRVETICTLELKRQPEVTDYDAERGLMAAIIK
jgi:hypothetical protein